MRRVMVVGSGGAGKSTFSDALGERTGLPVVHLDQHFWRPGWVETSREAWRAEQAVMVAPDAWIIDGNYSGTIDVRLARADTVILLDLGRIRCVWRVLKRTARNRGRDRTAVGCPDRFEFAFTKWVWDYRKRSRPRILDAVERVADQVDFVRLRTPRAVCSFLTQVGQPGQQVGDR